MPEILKHVRSRDIGAGGYYEFPTPTPESHQINEGLSKYRYENLSGLDLKEKCKKLFSKLTEQNVVSEMFNLGAAEMELRKQVVERVLPTVQFRELNGFRTAYFERSSIGKCSDRASEPDLLNLKAV